MLSRQSRGKISLQNNSTQNRNIEKAAVNSRYSQMEKNVSEKAKAWFQMDCKNIQKEQDKNKDV